VQGERSGTSRSSPPARAGAGWRHTSAQARASVLKSPGAEAASAGRLRPLAGIVKFDDWLIVLDRAHGRAGRRTLGPVPQSQVAEDLLDDGAGADQADDLKGSRAAGADQGIGFVDSLHQPPPGASAGAREFPAAVGVILASLPRSLRESRCRSGRPSPVGVGKSSIIADQLLSGIRDVQAQCGQEVECGKDAGRGGIAAGAPFPAVVDDLAGFRPVAQAFEGDRGMEHVTGQAPAGLMVIRIYALSLENGEARMDPAAHDFDQAGRDLFARQQRFDKLAAGQLHDGDGIGASDGDERAVGRNQAVGNQAMKMGMKPSGIIAVALERGDHAGEGAAIACGMLEQFLDGGVETLAQEAEQLAVIFEGQAQHLRDGDDVLAHREVARNLFIDVLGKEQGALLMARRTKTPSTATIWQQQVFATGGAPKPREAAP
jgi:hypothetical protein